MQATLRNKSDVEWKGSRADWELVTHVVHQEANDHAQATGVAVVERQELFVCFQQLEFVVGVVKGVGWEVCG